MTIKVTTPIRYLFLAILANFEKEAQSALLLRVENRSGETVPAGWEKNEEEMQRRWQAFERQEADELQQLVKRVRNIE